MDYDNIYPKIKLEDDTKKDYEIEISSKKRLFNKVKLLPSGNEKNFKVTNFSIETLWKINEFKTYLTNKLDAIANKIYSRNKVKTVQINIEIQTIDNNNIIKNISVASRKLGIISPIIPKKSRRIDEK